MANKQVKFVDPDQVVVVEDRDHYLWDERAAWEPSEGMIKNITQYGVKEPVLVKQEGKGEGARLLVVDGRQRVKALRAANERLAAAGSETLSLPVIVESGDEHQLMGLMVSLNEIRKDDDLLTKAKKVKRLVDNGMTQEQVAVAFGVTPAAVSQWMGVATAPVAVKKAVEQGIIPPSAARNFKGLGREEAEEAVGKLIKEQEKKKKQAEKDGKAVKATLTKAQAEKVMGKGKSFKPSSGEIKQFRGDYDLPQEVNLVLAWVLGEITLEKAVADAGFKEYVVGGEVLNDGADGADEEGDFGDEDWEEEEEEEASPKAARAAKG